MPSIDDLFLAVSVKVRGIVVLEPDQILPYHHLLDDSSVAIHTIVKIKQKQHLVERLIWMWQFNSTHFKTEGS